MSIVFLHTADAHLGTRKYSKLSKDTGENLRLNDFKQALYYLIDKAKERKAEIAFIAGDLFSSPNPSPEIETVAYGAVKKMLDYGIKPIILVGNHELPKVFGRHHHPFRPVEELELENLVVADRIALIPIQTKDTTLYVTTLPYPTRKLVSEISNEASKLNYDELSQNGYRFILEKIQSLLQNVPSDAPVVFMGHIFCSEAIASGWKGATSARGWMNAEEILFPIESLRQIPADYFALGHIHRFQDLSKGIGSPIVYSGSPERIDFGEEKEVKGGVIGELKQIGNRWQATYDFVKTPTRRFLTIEIDIRDIERPDELILKRIQSVNTKDCIVRVIINLRHHEERLIDRRTIAKTLSNSFLWKYEFRFAETIKKKKTFIPFNLAEPLSSLASYIDTKPELIESKAELLRIAKELFRGIG